MLHSMISTDYFRVFKMSFMVLLLLLLLLYCHVVSTFNHFFNQIHNAQIAHFTLLTLTDILVYGSNSNHDKGICHFSCEVEALK